MKGNINTFSPFGSYSEYHAYFSTLKSGSVEIQNTHRHNIFQGLYLEYLEI